MTAGKRESPTVAASRGARVNSGEATMRKRIAGPMKRAKGM